MLPTHMTNLSVYDTAHKFSKEDFEKLSKTNYLELTLFLLYVLGKLPEYNTVSGLMLMNTQHAFLRICEYFGGQTITIPTIKDMEDALKIIQMYNQIDIQGLPYAQVILEVGATPEDIIGYTKLKVLLEQCGVTTDENAKTTQAKQ